MFGEVVGRAKGWELPMAFRVKDASFLFNKGAGSGRTERELNLR